MRTSTLAIGLTIISVTLMVCHESMAQSKISYGARMGMNLASIKATYSYDDYYDDYYYDDVQMAAAQSESGSSSTSGWRPGLALSGFVNIPYNDRISFQPELSFLQRGHKDSETENGFTYETSTTLNYLELPLLVRYTIPMEGKISPAFTAGPTIGFLLGSNSREKINGVKNELDFNPIYRSTSFGFVIGAGVQYALPVGRLLFDIRYDLGLSNLNGDEEFSELTEKSRSVLFAIGFGF